MSGADENTSCEWFEASLAAGLYEPLPEAEQTRLDAHLAGCGTCRQTLAELRELVDSLPRGEREMAVDLWPALSARFARPRRRFAPWLTASAAAAAMVLFAVGVAYRPVSAPGGTAVVATNGIEQAVAQGRALATAGDFSGALKAYQAVLAAHAGERDAGAAQAALAELEFAHGQRFAEAYDEYAVLKEKYPDTWRANPLNADRFDLLSEARIDKFESLYALNAARNAGDAGFEQLERIAARPDRFLVGALAVDAMRGLVGGANANTAEGKVAALEKVRQRCTDPVAAAQVKLALAEVHWKDLHDGARARALLGEVAADAQPVVAQAGRAALARLEGAPSAP